MRGRKNISKNNHLGRAERENLHYKLRKHKKHWLATSLYTLSVGAVILLGGAESASADENNSNPGSTPQTSECEEPAVGSARQTPATPAGNYAEYTAENSEVSAAQTSQSTTVKSTPSAASGENSQATSQSAAPVKSPEQTNQTTANQAQPKAEAVDSPAATTKTGSSTGTSYESQNGTVPAANSESATTTRTGVVTNQNEQAASGHTASVQEEQPAAPAQAANSSGVVTDSEQGDGATKTEAAVPASPSTEAAGGDSDKQSAVTEEAPTNKQTSGEAEAQSTAPTRTKRSVSALSANLEADQADETQTTAKTKSDQEGTDKLAGLRQNYNEATNTIILTNATPANQQAAQKQADEIFKITGSRPKIQYVSTYRLAAKPAVTDTDYKNGLAQAQKDVEAINRSNSSAGATLLGVGDLGSIGKVLDAYEQTHAKDEKGNVIPGQVTTPYSMIDNNGKVIWSGTWDEGGFIGIGAKKVTVNDKSDNFKYGYVDYLSAYAAEVSQYINQIKTNALDPRFGDKLVNSNKYRASDLESNLSLTSLVNFVGTWLLNTTTKDNPEIFKYQKSTGLDSSVTAQTEKTVQSLQKFITVVLPFIQNGIIKQSMTDIRSIGMEYVDANGKQSVATPDKLAGDNGALELNGTLKTLSSWVGLDGAANSSTANGVYSALAAGIKSAILRQANIGVQTALNEIMDPATGASGAKYTSMKIDNYNPADPSAAIQRDQNVSTTDLMQATAYAWAKKVVVPVMQMAAQDKLTGVELKQSGMAIAEALVKSGAITQDDLDNLKGLQRSGVYASYQPSSEGALTFIQSLYNNEVGAVEQAVADFMAGKPAQNYLFVNEGNHDQATNTVANNDYNQVYNYLGSSNFKDKMMIHAQDTLKLYQRLNKEAAIAKDGKQLLKQLFNGESFTGDAAKITSPTLKSATVKDKLNGIIDEAAKTTYNQMAIAYNQGLGAKHGERDAKNGKAMTLGTDKSYSEPYQQAYKTTEDQLVAQAKTQAEADFNAGKAANTSAFKNKQAIASYNQAFNEVQATAVSDAQNQAAEDMAQNISQKDGVAKYKNTTVQAAYQDAYTQAESQAIALATKTGQSDYEAGQPANSAYSRNVSVKAAYETAYQKAQDDKVAAAQKQAVDDMNANQSQAAGADQYRGYPGASEAYNNAYTVALNQAVAQAKVTAEQDYAAGKKTTVSQNEKVQSAYEQAYQTAQNQTVTAATAQANQDVANGVTLEQGIAKYGHDDKAQAAYKQTYQTAETAALTAAEEAARIAYHKGDASKQDYSQNSKVQTAYNQAYNNLKADTIAEAKTQAAADMMAGKAASEGESKYHFDADAQAVYHDAYQVAKEAAVAKATQDGKDDYDRNQKQTDYSQNSEVQSAYDQAFSEAQSQAVTTAKEKAVTDMQAGVDAETAAKGYADQKAADAYRQAYEEAQKAAVSQAKRDGDSDYQQNTKNTTYSANSEVQAAYDQAFTAAQKVAASKAEANAKSDMAANISKEAGAKVFANDPVAQALYEKTYDDALKAASDQAVLDGQTDYAKGTAKSDYSQNATVQAAYDDAQRTAQTDAIQDAVGSAKVDVKTGKTKADGVKSYRDPVVIAAYEKEYNDSEAAAVKTALTDATADYAGGKHNTSYSPNKVVQDAYDRAYGQSKSEGAMAAKQAAIDDIAANVEQAQGVEKFANDQDAQQLYRDTYDQQMKAGLAEAEAVAKRDYEKGTPKQTTYSPNKQINSAYQTTYDKQQQTAISGTTAQANQDIAAGVSKNDGLKKYANDQTAADKYTEEYAAALKTAITNAETVAKSDYARTGQKQTGIKHPDVQAAYDQAFASAKQAAVADAKKQAAIDVERGKALKDGLKGYANDQDAQNQYQTAYNEALDAGKSAAVLAAQTDYQKGKPKTEYSQNAEIEAVYQATMTEQRTAGLQQATEAAPQDVTNGVKLTDGVAKFANDQSAREAYINGYNEAVKAGKTAAEGQAATDYAAGKPKNEAFSRNADIQAAYTQTYDQAHQTTMTNLEGQAAQDIRRGMTEAAGADAYKHDPIAQDQYKQDYQTALAAAKAKAVTDAASDYQAGRQQSDYSQHTEVNAAYEDAFKQNQTAGAETATKAATDDATKGVAKETGAAAFDHDPEAKAAYEKQYDDAVLAGQKTATEQAKADYQTGLAPKQDYSQNSQINTAYQTAYQEAKAQNIKDAQATGKADVEAGTLTGADRFAKDPEAQTAYQQAYQRAVDDGLQAAKEQAVADYIDGKAARSDYAKLPVIQEAYNQAYQQAKTDRVSDAAKQAITDIKGGQTMAEGVKQFAKDPDAVTKYETTYKEAVRDGQAAAINQAKQDYLKAEIANPGYAANGDIQTAYDQAYQQAKADHIALAEKQGAQDAQAGLSDKTGSQAFQNDPDAQAKYQESYRNTVTAETERAKTAAATDYQSGQKQSTFSPNETVQAAYDQAFKAAKDAAITAATTAGQRAGQSGDSKSGGSSFAKDPDAQKAFDQAYDQAYQEASKKATISAGNGQVTVTTGPDGQTTVTTPDGKTTSLPADGTKVATGQQTSASKDHDGNVVFDDGQGTVTTLDQKGQVTKVIETKTNPNTQVTTATTKDGDGQIIQVETTTKPTTGGTVITITTDVSGKLTGITVTVDDGRENKITEPVQPGSQAKTLANGETVRADHNGNVTVTDAQDQAVTTNSKGEVIGTLTQDNQETTRTLTLPDGHKVVTTTDQNGETSVTVLTPDGHENELEPGQSPTELKDQNQKSNGVIAVTDGQGNTKLTDGTGRSVTVDKNGQTTQIVTPKSDGSIMIENRDTGGQTQSTITVAPDGSCAISTPGAGGTTTEFRDQKGRVISQQPTVSGSHEVKPTENGLLITHRDENGKAVGTTTTVTDPKTGVTVITQRDDKGNLISELTVQPSGQVSVKAPQTTTGSTTTGSGAASQTTGTTSPVPGTTDNVTAPGNQVVNVPDQVTQTQSAYYQKQTGQTVVTTRGLYRYDGATFNKRDRIQYIQPGTVLYVTDVVIRPDGITRLQLADGSFITGLKNFSKFKAVKGRYHVDATAVIIVKAKGGVFAYSKATFHAGKRLKHLKAGTRLKVRRIVRSGGLTRFELTNGQYVTGLKSAISLVQTYHTTAKSSITVTAKGGVNGYSKAKFATGKQTAHYKKGQKLQVRKIVKSGLTTRFQLMDGTFVTANKRYVKV